MVLKTMVEASCFFFKSSSSPTQHALSQSAADAGWTKRPTLKNHSPFIHQDEVDEKDGLYAPESPRLGRYKQKL